MQVVQLTFAINSNIGTQSQRGQTPIDCKEDLLKLYPDRFEGIGSFKGAVHITIDKNVPPAIHPARKCLIHLKDDIKRELDTMEQLGVITMVT